MTKTKRKKLKPGDLLELHSPHGYSYVQFVGVHPKYGDTIRVLPGCFDEPPLDFTDLVDETGYLAFYPAAFAVLEKMAKVIAFYPLPEGIETPRIIRRHLPNQYGETVAWIIEEEGKESYRKKQLTDAERQFPISSIWNHEYLTKRIYEGWHPTQKG